MADFDETGDADLECCSGRERANTWPGVRPADPRDDFQNRRLHGRPSGPTSPVSQCSSRLGQISESDESLPSNSRRGSDPPTTAGSRVSDPNEVGAHYSTSPEPTEANHFCSGTVPAAAGAAAAPISQQYKAGHPSYVELITTAILSSPDKRMTLAEIYDWMVANVPAFKDQRHLHSSAGWKNSVRHNLSLHSRFKRVKRNGMDKPSWWTVDPCEHAKDRKHRVACATTGNKSCRITTMRLSAQPKTCGSGSPYRPRSSGSWSFGSGVSRVERRRASDFGAMGGGGSSTLSGRSGLAMGSLDRLRDEPFRFWELVEGGAGGAPHWKPFGSEKHGQQQATKETSPTDALNLFGGQTTGGSQFDFSGQSGSAAGRNVPKTDHHTSSTSPTALEELIARSATHEENDSAFASSTSLEESMEIGVDSPDANLNRFVKAITVTLREQRDDEEQQQPGETVEDCVGQGQGQPRRSSSGSGVSRIYAKPRIALKISGQLSSSAATAADSNRAAAVAALLERRLTVPAVLSRFLRPSSAEESRQILRVQTNSGSVQDVAVPAPLPIRVVIHSDKQCQTDDLEAALRQTLHLHSPGTTVGSGDGGGLTAAAGLSMSASCSPVSKSEPRQLQQMVAFRCINEGQPECRPCSSLSEALLLGRMHRAGGAGAGERFGSAMTNTPTATVAALLESGRAAPAPASSSAAQISRSGSALPDDLAGLDVEGDVDCNIMDILRYEMCQAGEAGLGQNSRF